MSFNKHLWSSASGEWETPQDLFDELDKEFGFRLDPCATDGNTKCPVYFTVKDDGLGQPWRPSPVFVNPPYGREIAKWVQKGFEEAQQGAVVVMLLPARTDTRWFHDYCMKAKEIRFLKGRLKFGGAKNSAPFPSMIVIFQDEADEEVGE